MKLPLFLSLALVTSLSAETLNSAKITQAIKDVKVYKGQAEGRAATVGETVEGSTSVTTGRRSRAELTFQDNTITRLGQNSIFSFRKGSREVELKQGSLLLQVPKNAGGARIRTATVTAAITGTTSMFEYNPGQWVKMITLEGTQEIIVKGQKDPIPVPAGQMIILRPDGSLILAPVTIDIAKLISTSALTNKRLFDELPQGARTAIEGTIGIQNTGKRTGTYMPTKKVISGPVSRTPIKGTETRLNRERRIIRTPKFTD